MLPLTAGSIMASAALTGAHSMMPQVTQHSVGLTGLTAGTTIIIKYSRLIAVVSPRMNTDDTDLSIQNGSIELFRSV
jgi:hypothetical protein